MIVQRFSATICAFNNSSGKVLAKKKIVFDVIPVFEDVLGEILVVEDFLGV